MPSCGFPILAWHDDAKPFWSRRDGKISRSLEGLNPIHPCHDWLGWLVGITRSPHQSTSILAFDRSLVRSEPGTRLREMVPGALPGARGGRGSPMAPRSSDWETRFVWRLSQPSPRERVLQWRRRFDVSSMGALSSSGSLTGYRAVIHEHGRLF